jgi:hypothetical protein
MSRLDDSIASMPLDEGVQHALLPDQSYCREFPLNEDSLEEFRNATTGEDVNAKFSSNYMTHGTLTLKNVLLSLGGGAMLLTGLV